MVAVAAPVGLVCVCWLSLVSSWVDSKSLRCACLFLLLSEAILTFYTLAAVSCSGCSSVFYLLCSWGQSHEYFASLTLSCDELSCHFSSILLLALILCFVFLAEYFEFDVNGVSIVLLSSLFSQLAFIFFCSFDVITLVFFWEWISMTSFFLILFWSMRVQTMKAALKVFAISQLGDLAFLCAAASLYSHLGSASFDVIASLCHEYESLVMPSFFFFSVNSLWCGGFISALWLNSAQVLFFPWLIDAMEAPVPISAQLHSSTLVIIGFYVLYSTNDLFLSCPIWSLLTLYAGSFTAIVASVLGFFQDDAKSLLACSTASQLGYVMTLIGVGSFTPSLVLLTFCCCNKAYAFVWLGSIMESRGGLSDVRGLRNVSLLWAESCGLFTAVANATIWPGAFVWQVKGLLVRGESYLSSGSVVWGVLALTWFLGSLYLGRLVLSLWRGPVNDVVICNTQFSLLEGVSNSDSSTSTLVVSTQVLILSSLLCYGPLAALLVVPCSSLA